MQSALDNDVLSGLDIQLPPLHSAQMEVVKNMKRFTVLSAGRRWGKTKLGVWLCLKYAWEGKRAWWIAPSYSMTNEAWADLRSIGIEYGIKVKEAERTIVTATGGSVQVRSADDPMKLRGAGLDFVVLDECAFMKPQTWAEVIRPALTEKKGSAFFISTPKGYNFFEKLYSEANMLDDWVRFTYPTITNPIIDPAELEMAKQEIGSFLYAQEYEAQFIEASGGLFKADWFDHYKIEERIGIDEEKNENREIIYKYKDKECRLEDCRRYATVDLATSTKQSADFTVITSVAITPEGKILILDIDRRRLEAPDLLPLLQRKVEQFDLAYVGIERAGYQLAFIQMAKREGLVVKSLKADRDKVSRAYPLIARMEAGDIFFPKNSTWFADVQTELLRFPEAEHDDIVDSLAYAVIESKVRKSIKVL
jgi:predicted phage terminase large subunit-like protein